MRIIEKINDLNEYIEETLVTVCGKITKIRKLGKLIFVVLVDQTGRCQIVFENENNLPLQRGDFISVQGKLCLHEGKIELHAEHYEALGTSNVRIDANEIPSKKVDKLFLRSIAMQSIEFYMNKNNFLPVTSPTIVGDWVEGKTNTFNVDYFGTKKYLTINSMLYHQIMLISGYNRIYEFSKVFRKDNSSVKDRLAEFVSLEISMTNSDKYAMMSLVEEMINAVMNELRVQTFCSVISNISFERISFQDLMEKSGCKSISGAQLSTKARAYLNDNYDSFVWVYGFPEEKRRFFVKSIDGVCQDYQLWYKGEHQVASGGERETNLELICEKLIKEGKNIESYQELLSYFKNGVPPMCEIGFGFDRFMLDVTDGDTITDFVAFPRNKNTKF